MSTQHKQKKRDLSRQAEEDYLQQTLDVVKDNLKNYGHEVSRMQEDIDEMLAHYHDNDTEVLTILNNTVTMHDHMKRALLRNEKALHKPYFGRIDFHDETLDRDETIYIGKGGISRDTTHQIVVDWRAPVANSYYENGLGKCSYIAPGEKKIPIDLKLKRTYEIEKGILLDYYDSEVVANDELLTKYLAKNKQAVLGEIIATIQKEQNDIIRKSPYHNIIVQGVAGSGKTTVAMHRISFILYNYPDRFKPDDFYIVGSNRILLNYITGVLPDLDVYGIRQMTMEQLFVRLLYEDWDEKKYRIKKSAQSSNQGSIKGTSEWFLDLKNFCDELEWNSILRESIYLNPKQFVEGLRDGKNGVYDTTVGKQINPYDLVRLVDGEAVERYIRQNPKISMQSKINMLNDRLIIKIKEEFLGKGVKYTEAERKAILKAYRGRYGEKIWKGSIYALYQDFLKRQAEKGKETDIPSWEFDVYDLAALAYLYKRIKETEVISEAHHIVIDEAQDFGMMAYSVLHFCIEACTYTIMGDVSQNIHFGFGLNDWEELRQMLLPDPMDSFGILKKSYRNTVEISEFATAILHHGQFSSYPVEPIIRHGDPVRVEQCSSKDIILKTAQLCKEWQSKGFETIAVVCRNQRSADMAAEALSRHIEVMENDLEKAVFGNGIMVLPVEYTKGLEFDTVLILDPVRAEYPVDDGHAKLLYVAATRALHELCVLHTGDLTGLIADPLPDFPAPDSHKIIQNQPEKKRAGRAPDRRNDRISQQKQTLSVKTDLPGQKRVALPKSSDQGSQHSAARKELPYLQSAAKPKAVLPPSAPPKPSALTNLYTGKPIARSVSKADPKPLQTSGQPAFGDIPTTEKLRPMGHAKIDLAVKWVTKQSDGLYLQSRYGTLRLCPVGSSIIRITFAKSGQPDTAPHAGIAVNRCEKYWMYRDSGSLIELTTDELSVQIDKATGSIRYLSMDENSRSKNLLLAERKRECRQLESRSGGGIQTWLFLDFSKEEHLYGFCTGAQTGIPLNGTARYLSSGSQALPLLFSDKGYGILTAASNVFSCNIPAYGSYLHGECKKQMD